MSAFARATRASNRNKGEAPPSAVSNSRDLPLAVRQLLPKEDDWQFKMSRHLGKIEPETCNYRKRKEPEVEEEKPSEQGDDYFRFLCEFPALQELFQEAAVCKQCKKGSLRLACNACGVATQLSSHCTNEECKSHSATAVQKTAIPKESGQTRNTQFAANCLLVIAQLSSGDGGTETSNLLGFLDLPRATTFGKTSFPAIEDELAHHIIPHR